MEFVSEEIEFLIWREYNEQLALLKLKGMCNGDGESKEGLDGTVSVDLLKLAVMIMGIWSLPWGSLRTCQDRYQMISREQKDKSIAELVELGRPTCVGLPSLREQRPNELMQS